MALTNELKMLLVARGTFGQVNLVDTSSRRARVKSFLIE